MRHTHAISEVITLYARYWYSTWAVVPVGIPAPAQSLPPQSFVMEESGTSAQPISGESPARNSKGNARDFYMLQEQLGLGQPNNNEQDYFPSVDPVSCLSSSSTVICLI